MPAKTLNQLRSQISTLSESERAALAHELTISLDGPPDNAAEQAWNDEISQRTVNVRKANATLLSREECRQQIRMGLTTQG